MLKNKMLSILISCLLPIVSYGNTSWATFTVNNFWFTFGYKVLDLDYRYWNNPDSALGSSHEYLQFSAKKTGDHCVVICTTNTTVSYINLPDVNKFDSTELCNNFATHHYQIPQCTLANETIVWPFYDEVSRYGIKDILTN